MTHIPHRLYRFALVHDDLPAFHAGYLILTVLTAAMLNLGVFAVLVVGHMTLDVLKYGGRFRYGCFLTAYATLRESILDIALVLLGLTFAVYLHHSLPVIAGLRGLALAEITGVRFAAMFGSKLHILYDVLHVFSGVDHYLALNSSRLRLPLTIVEWASILTIVAALVLLGMSTHILSIDGDAVLAIVSHELVPGLE